MNENKLIQDYSIFREELFTNPEFAVAMKVLQLKLVLGHAIIKARIERGMSQTALAKAIGTQQANISRIEAGLGNPTIELIQRLVNYLDLEVKITAKTSAENEMPSPDESIPTSLAW